MGARWFPWGSTAADAAPGPSSGGDQASLAARAAGDHPTGQARQPAYAGAAAAAGAPLEPVAATPPPIVLPPARTSSRVVYVKDDEDAYYYGAEDFRKPAWRTSEGLVGGWVVLAILVAIIANIGVGGAGCSLDLQGVRCLRLGACRCLGESHQLASEIHTQWNSTRLFALLAVFGGPCSAPSQAAAAAVERQGDSLGRQPLPIATSAAAAAALAAHATLATAALPPAAAPPLAAGAALASTALATPGALAALATPGALAALAAPTTPAATTVTPCQRGRLAGLGRGPIHPQRHHCSQQQQRLQLRLPLRQLCGAVERVGGHHQPAGRDQRVPLVRDLRKL